MYYQGDSAKVHLIVKLNKTRWEGIIPEFRKATNDYTKENAFFLVQTMSKSGKTKYFFSTKLKEGNIAAEDSVCVPNEVIGRWLAELSDRDVAEKLEKIFRIINIRRQAIYDLRKLPEDKILEKEAIADRYLKRMRQFAKSDPDIIVPKETVYNGAKGVWLGQMDAKREIFELKDGAVGRKILAVV